MRNIAKLRRKLSVKEVFCCCNRLSFDDGYRWVQFKAGGAETGRSDSGDSDAGDTGARESGTGKIWAGRYSRWKRI